MTARALLPSELRSKHFSVAEALHLGATPDRLDASDLGRFVHGARSRIPIATVFEHAASLQPVLRHDQAFTSLTAAVIWGLPLPIHLQPRLPHSRAGSIGFVPGEVLRVRTRSRDRVRALHVVTLGRDVAMHRPYVIGHRSGRRDTRIVTRHGLRVVDPVATWVSLGALLSVDELIVAGDAIVGHEPIATIEAMRLAISHAAGLRGVERLRSALVEIRPGSRSPQETRLRLVLERGGLPPLRINHDVVMRDGTLVATTDLAWPDARIAFEYEGDHHRVDREQFRKDITRVELLKEIGWWTVRVTADDLTRVPERFVARMRSLRAARLVTERRH